MDIVNWVSQMERAYVEESARAPSRVVRASFCSFCNRQFPSPEDRALHVANSPAHPRCLPCDRRFLDSNALANHCRASGIHRQALRSRSDIGTRRDLETAVIRGELETLDAGTRTTLQASQQTNRENPISTFAHPSLSAHTAYYTSNRPLTSESTTYAREVRPSIAQPTFPYPNVPVTHPLTAERMARTALETQPSTIVPTVRVPEITVHREYGDDENNGNLETRETYEIEGISFMSIIRSLWGGWGNNAELQPPVDQSSPSTQSGSTIGRASGTTAAKRTAKQYQGSHNSEEGYKCPLCWDKKTNLNCLRCGHVFCTSCINQSLNARSQCPLCRQTASSYDLRRIYFSA